MGQSLAKLYVHLVFSTKHRQPLLLPPLQGPKRAYLATVLKNQDSPAVKIGGARHHVHILFRLSKNSAWAASIRFFMAAAGLFCLCERMWFDALLDDSDALLFDLN